MVEPDPIEAPLLTTVFLDSPVGFRLQVSRTGRGAGIGIIDESYAVSDKYVVLDLHTFAYEGMARDLAALARPWRFSEFRQTHQSWSRRQFRSRRD